MKKILGILTIIVIIFSLIIIPGTVKAQNVEPQYDSTFNNNKGILYANGNAIVIDKNEDGTTVVRWKGGNINVAETVTIIGGGNAGTTFEKSDITMNDGKVRIIYGAGISLDENSTSTVKETNITINGGIVSETVYGGGLIYTTVESADVEINGGTIKALCGGGSASAVISGVAYSAGTEENPKASKNIVEKTDVTINGGKIYGSDVDYGLLFGGGQGYSYVGETELEIKNGDLSKAYVTAGGSNGYTGKTDVKVKGGQILLLQTVNRGKIDEAKVEISGGNIQTVYVGSEEEASTTGTVEKVDFDVIDGKIVNLKSGNNRRKSIKCRWK